MTKKTLFAVLLVVVALFSATFAFADGDEVGPMINDGRLNAFDINAPVAVYRESVTVPLLDENGIQIWQEVDGVYQLEYQDQFSGYGLWAYTSDGSIDKIAEVSAAQIDAAVGMSTLVQVEGYSVTYDAATSTFTVVAANGYSFSWIG